MTTGSSQAVAEYVGIVAKNAANVFQAALQGGARAVQDRPVLVAVAVVLVLVLFWWTRPKAR